MIYSPFCECGCGERVAKKGNRFRSGHNMRGVSKPPEMIVAIVKAAAKVRSGRSLTEEHKLAISEANKGKAKSPEHCAAISKGSKGKIFSDDHRRKIGEAGKGRIMSDETKKKICDGNKGKVMSEDAKRKIGDGNRGKVRSEENKKLISDTKTGVPMSEETKKKISNATKGENNPMFGRTGENSPGWKGGVSFEPYCEEFNYELKRQIRNQYNNRDYFSGLPDYICNLVRKGRVEKLSIHHVDGNKMQGCNGIKCHLIPLSRKNHSYIHANQSFWERLICYALEYDKTYYNIKQINIKEIIEWKQTTEVISNTF